MSNEAIKDCPFCGDKAYVADVYMDCKYTYFYIVRCQNELCRAQTGLKPSEAAAIKAWNRRKEHRG